jgi:hypothetical protein
MLNSRQGIFFILISILATATSLHAAHHGHEAHKDDGHKEHKGHEQHAAHVHGEAELLVALEGNSLDIEFLSPAMNIVGFEHQPTNEAQSHSVESAVKTLQQPGLLFNLPEAAQCQSVSVEVETPLAWHDKHEHGHSKQGADKHSSHGEETHSDFTGHYRFTCAQMPRLNAIVIEIFKQFPGTERIDAQHISSRGQGKKELTPSRNTLEL